MPYQIPALLQGQQLGALTQPNSFPALISPEQAGMPIPQSPLDTARDFLNFSFDHIWAPLMDHINRTSMSPDERAQAISSSPDYAQAAKAWDDYMNYYRNVISPGQ